MSVVSRLMLRASPYRRGKLPLGPAPAPTNSRGNLGSQDSRFTTIEDLFWATPEGTGLDLSPSA
jgi:hypothetical protein